MNRRRKKSWRVYFHSSEEMHEIEDSAAQLAIASPPFTNHPDGKTLDKKEYIEFLERVFAEVYRALKPNGILVTINTDLRDHARYNGRDLRFDGLVWHKHAVIRQIAEGIGFRCTNTKIWAKSLRRNVYRYTFAYMLFFEKPSACATHTVSRKVADGFGPDVWLLERGTYRRDTSGLVFRDAIHPEIVRRCVEQFTSPGDLVMSPFTGSGTVVAVAHIMGRQCIGYEVNRDLEPLIVASIRRPAEITAYQGLLQ